MSTAPCRVDGLRYAPNSGWPGRYLAPPLTLLAPGQTPAQITQADAIHLVAVDLIDHTAPPPAMPAIEATAAYGEYLTRSCSERHGAQLNGMPFGPPGQAVPSPNLTPGGALATWSEADFVKTLRTGITPSNKVLNTEMPWLYYGWMTDEELQAVWLYLQSLPALPQGG